MSTGNISLGVVPGSGLDSVCALSVIDAGYYTVGIVPPSITYSLPVIPFMLTGSVAMNYYAQPRMTRDIDLVISLNETQIEEFLRLFESEYYLDRKNVTQAVARRGMFNLIHTHAVIKVDCVVLKADPYRQEEFARRREIDVGDFRTWIVRREDLILSNLFWARDSKSEVQLRDVRNLLSTDCDMEYLNSRAKTLKVDTLLDEILGDE